MLTGLWKHNSRGAAFNAYRGRDDVIIEPTPIAATIASQVVSLPVHNHLSREDLDTIIAAVRGALKADA